MELSHTIDDEAAWSALLDEVRAHGGLMVAIDASGAPDLFTQVTLTLRNPSTEIVKVQAQVVQHLGAQMALLVDGEEKEKLLAADFAGKSDANQPRGSKVASTCDQIRRHTDRNQINRDYRQGRDPIEQGIPQDPPHRGHDHYQDEPDCGDQFQRLQFPFPQQFSCGIRRRVLSVATHVCRVVASATSSSPRNARYSNVMARLRASDTVVRMRIVSSYSAPRRKRQRYSITGSKYPFFSMSRYAKPASRSNPVRPISNQRK